jgi:hypothetical protein
MTMMEGVMKGVVAAREPLTAVIGEAVDVAPSIHPVTEMRMEVAVEEVVVVVAAAAAAVFETDAVEVAGDRFVYAY